MKLRIAHPPSIVPDVVNAIPRLFAFACVAVQRLHQGGQTAPIEFVIALLDPFLGFHAIAVDSFASLAELFFGLKPVENCIACGNNSVARRGGSHIQAAPSASTT
ncbi:MAG: hypothetical protein ACYDC6_12250 [Acidobacteriaceae bacterium]